MNSRFERLYSLPNQLYSPTAPVIITAGALLKDTQTDRVLAQLKIKNISPKIIKAVSISLLPLDTAMRTLGERETYQLLDLSAGRDTEFGQKTPLYLSNNAARAYQVIIDDVVFSDNTVWQSDGAVLSDLPSQKSAADALADAELAKQYKLELGENADYIADSCFDLWRCHCGAVNHSEEANCHSCNTSKEAALSFDLEQLKTSCQKRLEEEHIKSEQELVKSKLQKKKAAKRKLLLLCSVLLIVLVVIFANLCINKNVANRYMKSLEDSKFTFDQMAEYQEVKSQYKGSYSFSSGECLLQMSRKELSETGKGGEYNRNNSYQYEVRCSWFGKNAVVVLKQKGHDEVLTVSKIEDGKILEMKVDGLTVSRNRTRN